MVFVLPREATLHFCSIRAEREVSREREKNDSQSSLWRTLWGGGNVDTVYCSCTVKKHALASLCVYLGWWMQGVRGDESCHLFALWERKECTFPFRVNVTFTKEKGRWEFGSICSLLAPLSLLHSLRCLSAWNHVSLTAIEYLQTVVCIYVLQCNSTIFRYSTEWMNNSKCPLSQTFYFFVTKTSEIDF